VPTLRETRQEYFLSQQELADAAAVAKSTVVAIEQGRHKPQPRTARAIARALGVAPKDINWPMRQTAGRKDNEPPEVPGPTKGNTP